jgi:hypothetical protein
MLKNENGAVPVEPVSVPEALQIVAGAERGLLALGIPRCGACELLPTSLGEIARARRDLVVAFGRFASPDDWRAREELLWPRGVHVSRSTMPSLALLENGEAVAARHGGGPAAVIDAWLETHLGPAAIALGAGATPAEWDALGAGADLRAVQAYVKGVRLPT